MSSSGPEVNPRKKLKKICWNLLTNSIYKYIFGYTSAGNGSRLTLDGCKMSLKLYHFKFTAYTKNNVVRPGFVSQLAGSRERARELVKIEFKKLNIRLKDLEDWEE